MINQIGLMQGRLVEPSLGKIQEFPRDKWDVEIDILPSLGLNLLEWTIDLDGFWENPYVSKINRPCALDHKIKNNVRVESITCDYFMHQREKFGFHFDEGDQELFQGVIEGAKQFSSRFIVIPLVDHSRVKNHEEEEKVVRFFSAHSNTLIDAGLKVVFESDYEPSKLADFIRLFSPECFGINYDMGNSASLGYEPAHEICILAPWIDNVHVKDRVLGGTTVPFGEGNVDFQTVFSELRKIGYTGNLILQGARSKTNDHVGIVKQYLNHINGYLA